MSRLIFSLPSSTNKAQRAQRLAYWYRPGLEIFGTLQLDCNVRQYTIFTSICNMRNNENSQSLSYPQRSAWICFCTHYPCRNYFFSTGRKWPGLWRFRAHIQTEEKNFNSFSSSRSRQSSREPQSPFIPSDEIFHHTVFESCPSGWIVGQLGWIALFLVGLSQGREMLLLSNHFLVNTRSSVIKSHETSESA